MLDHLNHAEQRINSQALTTEIGNKKGLCKMRGQKKANRQVSCSFSTDASESCIWHQNYSHMLLNNVLDKSDTDESV